MFKITMVFLPANRCLNHDFEIKLIIPFSFYQELEKGILLNPQIMKIMIQTITATSQPAPFPIIAYLQPTKQQSVDQIIPKHTGQQSNTHR